MPMCFIALPSPRSSPCRTTNKQKLAGRPACLSPLWEMIRRDTVLAEMIKRHNDLGEMFGRDTRLLERIRRGVPPRGDAGTRRWPRRDAAASRRARYLSPRNVQWLLSRLRSVNGRDDALGFYKAHSTAETTWPVCVVYYTAHTASYE